ncbi:MAG: decaprenyl-phosphate phosphoribosyltransferase [Coriobacteriales bacterium]|nr:decaprenyl-phosphate phosphoribosyltransferase [Coriobacteriales bacterium]
MTSIADIISLFRPKQWTKNLAVFAAIIFAGELFDLALLARVGLAFVALCAVSAGLYALNDAFDAERDRQHPIKAQRPVASGRISVGLARALGVGAIAAGLALAYLLGLPFLAAVVAYGVLQVAYIVALKNVVIVDMLVIALGFVIRAVSGALVISVAVSPWLVICTGLLALFLSAAKRRHELLLLAADSSSHRPVLAEYTAELLDSFMVTLSAATVTSYAMYTFFEHRGPGYSMMLTIPFVIYGILRYQYLVLRKAQGGRPEDVLLQDAGIIVAVCLWVAAAVFVLYALPAVLG